MEELLKQVGNFGFPIVVSIYLLVRVESKLENIPSITDVVVVSASGEKHAPIILTAAKKHGKKIVALALSVPMMAEKIFLYIFRRSRGRVAVR